MFTNPSKTAIAIAAALLTVGPSNADELGKAEYELFCAVCHGKSGKGDGSAAELLINGAPDLTKLAANNGGTFPLARVVEIIDGRSGLRGHDGTSMPLFGRYFTRSFSNALRLGLAPGEPENTGSFFDPEVYALGQELALAYYIESLQE